MVGRELVLKCFPHKEAVLYNIDVAIDLANKGFHEIERAMLLCECGELLRDNKVEQAINKAKHAGYFTMAQAINIHFQTRDENDTEKE